MKFNYEELKRILVYAKTTTDMLTVTEAVKKNNGLIIRHDIDHDISFALEVARLEKDLSVKSTFYVRMTACYYNPMSRANRALLRKIHSYGFEIGLHFDPSIEYTTERFNLELMCLENILGSKVRSFSSHNPSIHGIYMSENRVIDADKLVEDGISDSLMSFKEKNPYEYVDRSKTMLILLLLHPLYWVVE